MKYKKLGENFAGSYFFQTKTRCLKICYKEDTEDAEDFPAGILLVQSQQRQH